MIIFGELSSKFHQELCAIQELTSDLVVTRSGKPRSSNPLPTSRDLELALTPLLDARNFVHHKTFSHPKTDDGFEYDFWRIDGIAMEVMGYRADDEVYKDLLKFHVHKQTTLGVVWVPRWKWVSGKKGDRNYRATLKALAFADSYLAVEALVALPYEWIRQKGQTWHMKHVTKRTVDSDTTAVEATTD